MVDFAQGTDKYSPDFLLAFVSDVFRKCGMPEHDASLAAEALLSADLRGIDSHGVARLSGYIRLWQNKRANFKPDLKLVHETPSTLTVDADGGLGLVSASRTMELVIAKAKNTGTAWAAIRNSNHFGIAAYHAMKALPHDMIGIAMTNASPLVAPTNSSERMLGTNPICVCIPAGEQLPFVLDMASAAAANGKLEIAQRMGRAIPGGWAQDKNGAETHDADILKKGGALLPLGHSSEAGHKGYGLGAMVDILCGVLGGANYGPWVPPFVRFLDPVNDEPGKGIGHFVGAMRIDAFRPANEFKENMDRWILRFKQAKRIRESEPVLIPGEPEFITLGDRKKNGIPLNEKVVEDLRKLAKSLGLEF